jgi:hypothetical protein
MGAPSAPELLIILVIFVLPLTIGIIMHNRQEKVILINEQTGISKKVPVGYSWITLAVGFFLPMYRGDLKWFIFYFLAALFSYGVGPIILAFFYNKNYIQSLIEKGYSPINDASRQLLIQKNIIVK